MEVHGVAEITISRGAVVWESGTLHTKKGHGKFIPRLPFGYSFEGLDAREKGKNRWTLVMKFFF